MIAVDQAVLFHHTLVVALGLFFRCLCFEIGHTVFFGSYNQRNQWRLVLNREYRSSQFENITTRGKSIQSKDVSMVMLN